MCGIAGFSGFNAPGLINKMCDIIYHRGPDGEGIAELPRANTTLGMRRLAIIDVENGRQPFVSPDDNVYLIYNGEIYNHVKLRDELRELGYSFNTK